MPPSPSSESAASLNQLVQLADEIGATIVARERPHADASGAYVSESMQALKREKLTGLVVPQECGGHGLGLYSLARISETLGVHYASVGLCYGMHCVGSAVIAAKATSCGIRKNTWSELRAASISQRLR